MPRLILAAGLIIAACTSATPRPTGPAESPGATASPSPSVQLSISAVQRVNASVGFVSGWGGSGLGLARTVDGGATWKKIAIPVSFLTALRFIDADVGWVTGFANRDANVGCQQASSAPPCRSVVLVTADGGTRWREVLSLPVGPGAGEMISSLQAVDAAYAWVAVGESCYPACAGQVRATADGGKTWHTIYQGKVGPVRFVSPGVGWIAAYGTGGVAYGADGGNVLVTRDGGATWTVTLRGQPIVAIDAADDRDVWALARDGAFCSSSSCAKYELFRSTDGGTSWTSLGNPKNQLVDPCSGGHLAGPVFVTPSRGWFGLNEGAGGAAGIGSIVATDDGGQTWGCARANAEVALVSAPDADHVWAIDTGRGQYDARLLSSDDGGKSWRTIDLSPLR